MGATLDRSAAIGQQAITISGPAARRGGPAAGRCVARMGTQAAHAHLHGIECVERSGRYMYVFFHTLSRDSYCFILA